MTRRALGTLVFLALPIAGFVAIVAVGIRDPWPTFPLAAVGIGAGFLGWYILSRPRFTSKQLSGRLTFFAIVAAVVVAGLLQSASRLEVAVFVAVVEGYLTPVVWRVMAKKGPYRSNSVATPE